MGCRHSKAGHPLEATHDFQIKVQRTNEGLSDRFEKEIYPREDTSSKFVPHTL